MPQNDFSVDVPVAHQLTTVIVPEAIVVVDVVESTFATNLFGWYAIGRGLMRDLRNAIVEIGTRHGLRCMKSTGDGYLLTYGDANAAELGAVHAVEAAFELIERLSKRNQDAGMPEEARINLRATVHFGQVDVIENDREGPNVSYTFRLEQINREALRGAINAIQPEDLPIQNYILCSEPVQDILVRRGLPISASRLGLFRFKGFPDWHEVFLLGRDVLADA
jgi:class 3 adenylate cyclase